jgi:type IV secretion system T-DNA border endonuclease VirD1
MLMTELKGKALSDISLGSAMADRGQQLLSDMGFFLPVPSKKEVDPNGYKIVSVRLREAEFEAFCQQARALGLTNNMALRIAARRIGGFLEIDSATRARLETIVQLIGSTSHNLSKLHASCAQSGKVDMAEFATHRAAFGQAFAELDGLLRSILNVSRRRRDGRLMLQEQANP